MKVSQFMKTDVIVAKKDNSVKETLETLVQHKIGGVPIVDNENKLVGIVSDGDLLRFVNPNEESVYDFFTFVFYNPKEELLDSLKRRTHEPLSHVIKHHQKVMTLHPHEDMEKALAILAKYHYKRIPVVDNEGKVVGIISRGDILREINQIIID